MEEKKEKTKMSFEQFMEMKEKEREIKPLSRGNRIWFGIFDFIFKDLIWWILLGVIILIIVRVLVLIF